MVTRAGRSRPYRASDLGVSAGNSLTLLKRSLSRKSEIASVSARSDTGLVIFHFDSASGSTDMRSPSSTISRPVTSFLSKARSVLSLESAAGVVAARGDQVADEIVHRAAVGPGFHGGQQNPIRPLAFDVDGIGLPFDDHLFHVFLLDRPEAPFGLGRLLALRRQADLIDVVEDPEGDEEDREEQRGLPAHRRRLPRLAATNDGRDPAEHHGARQDHHRQPEDDLAQAK